MRRLESQEQRVANHASHEATSEVSNFVCVFVEVFLVEAENPLVALEESDRAGAVQLTVKSPDYLLLQSDKLLLGNDNAPLFLDEAHHTVERGGDGLLQLGGHQRAYAGQADQARRLLSFNRDVNEVSISEATC